MTRLDPKNGFVMNIYQLKKFLTLFFVFYFSYFVNIALSQPKHAISMYDAPQLPHDFVSLPYGNFAFGLMSLLWEEVGTNHLHFMGF